MARGKNVQDAATLQMALVGYGIEKQRIEEKIKEIQSRLKGKRISTRSSIDAKPRTKRFLSPDARKRIAAAQKKRWAEHRKKVGAAGKAE